MTVKELVNASGASERTVRKYIKELFPGVMRHGALLELNQDQSESVMAKIKSNSGNINEIIDETVSYVPMLNSKKEDFLSVVVEQNKSIMEQNKVLVQLVSALTKSLTKNDTGVIPAPLALPAPEAEQRLSVAGYCSWKKKRLDDYGMSAAGKDLSAMCRDRAMPIHKVPQGGFFVNVYPIALLDEYFGYSQGELFDE